MQVNALAERIQRAYHVDLNEKILHVRKPVDHKNIEFLQQVDAGGGNESVGDNVLVSQEIRGISQNVEEEIIQLDLGEGELSDWVTVQQEIEELQERIDRMGPVNVEAITEYEELEQRLNFLETQEKDLKVSRDQLHEAIKKINETTRTLFADTFAKIQKNFSEMFVELFGGGKASLNLVSDDDPLESGIEIVAKPPGKQLQTISLLSGGERTMTAVALLFAIYMVKPSPFCVLDEMDAPLDESNIMRFIKILKRFVTQSQFVVITHNKRTISSADVLYGVTMEEHGISKIVSVKLSRKDEDPLFQNNEDDIPTIADAVRGVKMEKKKVQLKEEATEAGSQLGQESVSDGKSAGEEITSTTG
jgi:chromosome segregation protein